MKPPSSYTESTDQDVVRHALAGSERAYRELVTRYERPVFSLIYRMVRDRDRAEDLAQDAFVKALNALESYQPKYKFSSWMFKIANNVAIDHIRKKQLDTVSLQASSDPSDEGRSRSQQIGSGDEDPLEEMEARELGSAIERAVGELRPEYQACILMRYVEGYAYEEIAEALELPLGTVKTYIHRARSELKEMLQDAR